MTSTLNPLTRSCIFNHEQLFNKKNNNTIFSTTRSPIKRNLIKKGHKQINSYAVVNNDYDNINNPKNLFHSLIYSQSMTNIGTKIKSSIILNESDEVFNKNRNNKKLIKVNVKLGLSVSPRVSGNTARKYKKYNDFQKDINKIIKIQKLWKEFFIKKQKDNSKNINNNININNKNKNSINNNNNKKKKPNNILNNTEKKKNDRKNPIKLRSSTKGQNKTTAGTKKSKNTRNSLKSNNQNFPKKNLVNFNLNRPPSLLSLHPATINLNSNDIPSIFPSKNLSHRKKCKIPFSI